MPLAEGRGRVENNSARAVARTDEAPVSATDIRIEDVAFGYEDYRYRTPIKFGGVAVHEVTLLNVECAVRTAGGRTARGFGSMPLGNVWSFPSRVLGYEQTLGAMKTLVERVARITSACTESGHPIELTHALEPSYVAAAREVGQISNLPDPIPILCTLVCASP